MPVEVGEETYVDDVLITREDLSFVRDALANLTSFSEAQDLANQYKNLAVNVKLSPLTKQGAQAVAKLTQYIITPDVDEDVSEE